jgi:surface antigen
MRSRRIVWSLIVSAAATAEAWGTSAAQAADICGETVPANRFIDGFPAYAQCPASMTGAVYSNNGIDTSTTSGGAGWVRTQWSGGYQCTELAHRYLLFKWNVPSVPNGNAGVWCDSALPDGLVKTAAPVHGDLLVLAPGSCGADANTGHVAVIDVVNADGSMMVVQQNVASRGRFQMGCAACFLHATANAGTAVPDAGVPGPDAGGGTDAAAGGAGGGGMGGGAGTSGAAGGASGGAGAGGPTETGAAGIGGAGVPPDPVAPVTTGPLAVGCTCETGARDLSRTPVVVSLLWAALALSRRRRRS